MKGSRTPGFLLIAGANILAGTTYPAQKLALEGLPPGVVSTIRNVIAVGLMAVFFRAIGATWGTWERRDWIRIAFLGVVAYGLPMYLGIVGVQHSTAANGSILVLLEPVTVLILSYLYLSERISLRRLLGIGVGLVGACSIVFEGATLSDLTAGENFYGNVLLVLHALLWGCFVPFAKPLMDRGHDGYGLSGLSLAFSLLVMVPASLPEVATIETGPELAPALGWTVFLAITGSFGVMWSMSRMKLYHLVG